MRAPLPEGAAAPPSAGRWRTPPPRLGLDLRPAPLGVAGELAIGGTQVGRGYWGAGPDGGAFLPDPLAREAGGRLYRTGDLVRAAPTAPWSSWAGSTTR